MSETSVSETAQKEAPRRRIGPTAWTDATGAWQTRLRGRHVLSDPRVNKGTAFSDAEREALGVVGLIPPAHLTLEQQAARVYGQYQDLPSNLAKNVMLGEVRDRNEVLYYRILADHLTEMLPIVYTPTVGEAIERYSREYRRPRGVYLSVDRPEQIEEALLDTCLRPDEVDLVVATDSQAILGIGDWGVGGIDIAAGKLAVYTAAGGIRPDRAIPVMLDVGTDRPSLLEDPMYIGNRHPRVAAEVYDRFVDRFVETVTRLFPDAMLHWEDIGVTNARRLLEKYRPDPDLQRRRPGHRRGQPGRRTVGGAGHRDPPRRAPGRGLRHGHRRHRHRRPAPERAARRRDEPR